MKSILVQFFLHSTSIFISNRYIGPKTCNAIGEYSIYHRLVHDVQNNKYCGVVHCGNIARTGCRPIDIYWCWKHKFNIFYNPIMITFYYTNLSCHKCTLWTIVARCDDCVFIADRNIWHVDHFHIKHVDAMANCCIGLHLTMTDFNYDRITICTWDADVAAVLYDWWINVSS